MSFDIDPADERSELDMCIAEIHRQQEQITSLQARNKLLEEIKDAAASVLSEEGVTEYLSSYVMGVELIDRIEKQGGRGMSDEEITPHDIALMVCQTAFKDVFDPNFITLGHAYRDLRRKNKELQERIKVLEEALHKIYTYRSDKPDWNMVMAIAGDIVNPMIAIPSKAARSVET